MGLLGEAAMALSFDIAPEAIVEHDDWHTHEHLNDRLSIKGFLRGTRWKVLHGTPAYFVLYEVADIGVLASPDYIDRLNHPSPWTTKMMTHYRGMQRGLCEVVGSFGRGLGAFALVVRFQPQAGRAESLRRWLCDTALPALPERPGLVSAHLLQTGLTPEITREQMIRGRDAGVDWLVVVSGYDRASVEALAAREDEASFVSGFARQGAAATTSATYRLVCALTEREAG